MLSASPARIYQIQDALERHRLRSRPPPGVWMPQVAFAEIRGWPDGYTDRGIEAMRAFFQEASSISPVSPAAILRVATATRHDEVPAYN